MKKPPAKRPPSPAGTHEGWVERSELLIALAMGVGMTRAEATRQTKKVLRDADRAEKGGRP
jgi:hypothetical protein